MSMSADVHETILSFCIANNIAQDKAIALLRDIVDGMNGDGDSYDFSFVANEYAKSNPAAQQSLPDDCPACDGGRIVLVKGEWDWCDACNGTGKRR